MYKDKLIYASAARKAILAADPKLAYCIDSIPGVDAVVFPCKPGTTVYEVSNNTDACYDCCYYGGGFGDSYCEKPGCNYISYPTIQDHPVCEKHFFEIISYPTNEQQLFDNRAKFGKTVFLTREEAEAALAKTDGDGNA